MSLQKKRTVTGPLPISLEQAKEWLRVETDEDDVLITSLIQESISLAEYWLNLSIPLQTIELQATARLELDLLGKPVIIINSVQDLDSNDLDYEFNGFSIVLNVATDMVVNYDAGYGDDVPDGLIVGLKELIAYLYENRGDSESLNKTGFILKNLAAYNKTSW